jgi:AcrR family transcriptional regulator
MARKPARKPVRKAAAKSTRTASIRGRTTSAAPSAPATQREKIVAAFLSLLAEKPIEAVELADVATRAKISLAQLRGEFSSTFAILVAHVKATDRAVLAEDLSEMEDEPARERLFDVLMHRLEILGPHRAALRSLLGSARRDPPLALALNGLALRSQQWMLTAAGIGASGPRGMIRSQGLAVLFGSVLRTWIDDDDQGQARTMAALDRALARGQRFAGLLDDLLAIPLRLYRSRPERRRRRGGHSGKQAAG